MTWPAYPDYVDSGAAWLGNVPSGWTVSPLKYVATVFPSNVDKHTRDGETPVRLCNYTDVYYNDRISGVLDFMQATATNDEIRKFTLTQGDTIITKDSETADDIGLSAYVEDSLTGVLCGYHLSVVRPSGRLNGQFVKRLFDSHYLKAVMEVSANGLTRVGLGQYAIDNLDIPLPPVDEQAQIADFLDDETVKIDALIGKQEQLISTLREDRTATITHAVTKGLDPDVEMKDFGIGWFGEVPAHWSVPQIGMHAAIGNGSTPSRDNPAYWNDGNIPWLNSGHVNSEEITEADQFVTELALRECHLPLVSPGSVLVGLTGQGKTRGMASILLARSTINQHLAYLTPTDRRLNGYYLQRVLGSAYRLLRDISDENGSTKGGLTCAALRKVRIPLPPLHEQREIVEFLNVRCGNIDVLIAKANEVIETLREYRSALITDAVTGKIDVRGGGIEVAQQHHESSFEVEICEYLADNGWLYSPTDSGYDRELALFPEDVFEWLTDTQPEQLAKRVKPDLAGEALAKAQRGVLATLVKALGADPKANGGTLAVLRRGFKDLNAQFLMCQFRPNTSLNETTKKRYDAVRLRVMRQVHYSTQNSNSIDLVFFVNGIPVATAELKTDFTQNITDAVLQYKHHRLPKGEPLLGFGSRTLVHFAVSNSEVQMTTKLSGKDTFFLPFNRGDHGHAGNPPNPHGSPTAYLWQTILQRDTWLDILGRFMHLHVEDKVDPVSGKKTRTETMLFPRFHQWEAVTRLVEAARTQGPGRRYLIQHSAGSGKSNSISWLTHRLAVLHDDANKPVFDSVIVITDRNVLDAQLQEAIRQIDRTPGVVAHIAGLGGAKSQELADALQGGTKIIIVTIQTFPFALELIRTQADLKGKNFAIIADEAHSSQAGEASKRLKAALTATELDDLADGGTVDAEDVLAAEMAARAESKNLSFFAFTATPKAKTLELFGHKGIDGLPHPFHLYSMQQAIEEGFILDVLKNYTPYKTAFRLTHNGQTYESEDTANTGTVAVTGADGELVDKSAAIKSVMNWVKLHPTNIAQKVQIIIEHFRANVGPRLGGRAKAMVVTSSRKAAVRYKLAFDKYIAEKGYGDVHALVAFSGEVTDLESAVENATETSMNPGLKGRQLRDAFATDEYNVLLVANKFQTGFDQPLLVAMYVDKRLSGVAAVQTLSRLNRVAPGKDQTFALDFTNTAEDIVEAFEPYYEATTLADVTDPNIVHETMNKLDAAAIYLDSEVEDLVADYLAHKGHEALSKRVTPARDRFRDRERIAIDHNDKRALDELELFRKDVGTFLRQYDFLSQIVNYEDVSLEKSSIYLRHLAPVIAASQLNHEIDLSTVDFDYIAQHKQPETSGKLTGDVPLQPAKESGTGTARDPEMVALDEVIAQINDLFSGDHPDSSLRNVVTHIKDRLEESEILQQQAQNNSQDQFSASPDLQTEFVNAVIGAMESHTDLSEQILSNSDLSQKLLGELVPIIYEALKATA